MAAVPTKLTDPDSLQFHALDPATATTSANLDANLRRRPLSGDSYDFYGTVSIRALAEVNGCFVGRENDAEFDMKSCSLKESGCSVAR